MADEPQGLLSGAAPTVGDAIDAAASQYGLDPAMLKGIAQIESSWDPGSNRNRSTQYKGLFQIGRDEWKQYGGGGDIYNAQDNANAAAKMLSDHAQWFNNRYGREPTPGELYMMHQQGRGFIQNGTMTNIAGNPYPGMRGPQTPQSFAQGWTDTLTRKMAPYGGANSVYANAGGNPAAPASGPAGVPAQPTVPAGPPAFLAGIGPGMPPAAGLPAVGMQASGGASPGAAPSGAAGAKPSTFDELIAMIKGKDENKPSPLVDLGKQLMVASANQPKFPFTPQPLAPAMTAPLHPLPLTLPKFGEGGIVDRPTVALVGESGPEAIVPLDAEQAREAAARRVRQAVQPAAGRQEGGLTELLNAIRASLVHGAMAGPRAMGSVASGELDPMSPEGIAAARNAAVQTVGIGGPFAVGRSLGSAGGKMVQPQAGFVDIPQRLPVPGIDDLLKHQLSQLRARNLQELGQQGYAVTHHLSDQRSIGTNMGESGHKHVLISPQGSPELYGNSIQDLMKRGFYPEDRPAIVGGPATGKMPSLENVPSVNQYTPEFEEMMRRGLAS